MEHDSDLFGFWDSAAPDQLAKCHPARCPAADEACSCDQDGARNFFQGACAPQMPASTRQQFFDSCLQAQDNERLRMGRELHDSTGQLLLALRLSVARLRRVEHDAESDEIFDEIQDMVQQIDHEIRAFSFAYYPAELGKLGLVAALHALGRGFSERTGLKIIFNSICHHSIPNGAAALALLRVAQEGLMNVHRHAHAAMVRMTLNERRDMIELRIQDDGCGLPARDKGEPGRGVGVQGMRHRIERLGGQFSIKGMKQGTRIVASIPANL